MRRVRHAYMHSTWIHSTAEIPRTANLLTQLPQFSRVAHWGDRIYQRGDGGEEEEGGGGGSGSLCRGGERGDNLSSADEVCPTKGDQLRQDDARSQGRESDTSPLHRRGTSSNSDGVAQAFSTLRQLSEATTSRTSIILSQTTFFHVQNASTSRLIR